MQAAARRAGTTISTSRSLGIGISQLLEVRSPFTYLMVFLLTVAVADIALQVRGPHIGRTYLAP